MNYRWRITYTMKGGITLMGFYTGPETDTTQVFKKLFDGSDFIVIIGSDLNSSLAVRTDEIVAVNVKPDKKIEGVE